MMFLSSPTFFLFLALPVLAFGQMTVYDAYSGAGSIVPSSWDTVSQTFENPHNDRLQSFQFSVSNCGGTCGTITLKICEGSPDSPVLPCLYENRDIPWPTEATRNHVIINGLDLFFAGSKTYFFQLEGLSQTTSGSLWLTRGDTGFADGQFWLFLNQKWSAYNTYDMKFRMVLGPETDSPTSSPTTSPTASPTTSPTSSPTGSPTASGISASAGGDPHFSLWSGEYFDYHGACDLVLLDVPGFGRGLGLTSHIRTTSRYSYSYIESVALKIGDDALEVSSWGDYHVNGVRSATLPALLGAGQFELTYESESEKEHVFAIELGSSGERIKIRVFKDMVNVKIDNASHGNFGTSMGLMGHFGDGYMMARDGDVVLQDTTSFAEEWQVQPGDGQLFETLRFPQYPQACVLPVSHSKEKIRRLGEATVSKEEAELACSHIQAANKKEMCISDVMATLDLDMAVAGFYY